MTTRHKTVTASRQPASQPASLKCRNIAEMSLLHMGSTNKGAAGKAQAASDTTYDPLEDIGIFSMTVAFLYVNLRLTSWIQYLLVKIIDNVIIAFVLVSCLRMSVILIYVSNVSIYLFCEILW